MKAADLNVDFAGCLGQSQKGRFWDCLRDSSDTNLIFNVGSQSPNHFIFGNNYVTVDLQPGIEAWVEILELFLKTQMVIGLSCKEFCSPKVGRKRAGYL